MSKHIDLNLSLKLSSISQEYLDNFIGNICNRNPGNLVICNKHVPLNKYNNPRLNAAIQMLGYIDDFVSPINI